MKKISFNALAITSIAVFSVIFVSMSYLRMNKASSEARTDTTSVLSYATENKTANLAVTTNKQEQPKPALSISGWIPYWAKDAGAASLTGKMNLFSEINPFAYAVNADGTLVDTMKIDVAPWSGLFAEANREDVRIVPTILWGDASAMHRTFSDSTLLDRHVAVIISMLDRHGFPGVDIDYEGKDIADRDGFSSFLTKLHEQLSADKGKTLSCTVEARTQEDPPEGFTGIRAMSYANDYAVLNRVCDSVRVMAYDQVFQIHRANTFTSSDPEPTAPNADDRWVEEVMRYALRYISPEKLILGVSTYGWEFRVEKVSEGYRYTRVKSISYPDAMTEARLADVTPTRTDGGELSFTYQATDGEHVVTFDDTESVRRKADIVKKLDFEGISIFKIDGQTDQKFFEMLGHTK